jgi:peptidyl-prolyl cis-trans isomerase D
MLRFFRGGGVAQALVGTIVGGIIVVFIVEFRAAGQGPTAKLKRECAVNYEGTCLDKKDFFAALGIVSPRGMSPAQAKRLEVRRHVLDGLVERELLVEAGHKLGLGIGEEALDTELEAGRAHVSIPAADAAEFGAQLLLCRLDPGGRCEPGTPRMVRQLHVRRTPTEPFDYKLYEREIRILANRGPKEFKANQEKELLADRVRELVRSRARVAAGEVDFVAERAVIRSAIVSRDWFAKYTVDTTPAAVDRWAFENRSQVDSAWNTEKENWTEGCPLIREVVIPTSPVALDDERSPEKQKAEEARSRIAGGEDFASVARELSNGPAALLGGEVGCLSKSYGVGSEELLKAVANMKPGERSAVLETPRGYHVVELQGRLGADKIEEVGRRHVALALYVHFTADEKASQFSSRLVERVKGGQKLEDAVREESLAALPAPSTKAGGAHKSKATGEPAALNASDRPRFEISPPFNRSGNPLPELEPVEAISAKVFELSKPDAVYEKPIQTASGWVVFQLKELTRPDAKEAAEISASLREVKADDALTRYVADLRKTAGERLKVDTSFGEDTSKPSDEE